MHDFIEVTVLNWKKYNPRKDVKKHTWFRFENDFWDNPDMAHLTSDDIVVFIVALSNCSRRQRETARINFRQVYANRGLTEQQVMASLRKLKDVEVLTFKDRENHAHVTPPSTAAANATYERTNVRTDVVGPDRAPETHSDQKRASATKVFDVSFSKEYQDFVKALEDEGFKPTPAQRRKLATAFTEWKQDLEAIREFISSKYKYAKTQGRNETEASRYALNAFIGEAVQ